MAWLEPSGSAPERVENYKVLLATEVSGTLRAQVLKDARAGGRSCR